MRIVAVHPILRSERIAPRAGGMARVAMRLTEGLIRVGHAVVILPIPERFASGFDLALTSGLAAKVFPPMDLPEGPDLTTLLIGVARQPRILFHWYDLWYRVLMMAGLRHTIRKFQPDIIHNHHATSPFSEMYGALGETIPTVLTHHHYEAGLRLRTYRAIAFPSAYARQMHGIPDRHNHMIQTVINNPVDPVFIEGPAELPERQKTIVFIGIFNHRKGILPLLQAYQASALLREYPLIAFGDGELMEDARMYVREHRLPVNLAGWQPPSVLRNTLSQAAALVLPSRQESFGVVMAESLCCGAPVVGWAPSVRELENVLQMPVGMPVEAEAVDGFTLAEKILMLIEDEAFSEAWRRRASKAAKDFFRLEQYVEKNLSLYEAVIRK